MVIPPPVRPPRIMKFLKPYVLKMHFTNKYVSAQVIHSPTSTVASSASSQEKALRSSMECTRDVAAAAKIGKILGDRLLLKEIPAVSVFLKREQKYHGKVKAVIDSLREAVSSSLHSSSSPSWLSSSFLTKKDLKIRRIRLHTTISCLASNHMGLLDHLWDETIAVPRPDNDLGKLRKHSTFTFRPNSVKESDGGSVRSYGDETSEEATRVTRTIMIIKPPGYQSRSPPVSPAGSTPPVSPFSESRIGFGEYLHQMRTRRPTRLDQGALILLTTCEI
ncbi:hypothetical protein CRYUN_Cryun16bG0008600 [Craigia yunnanensis]